MPPDRLAARAPSLDDFERLVRRAFADLPAPVRRACEGLALRVDDFPPDDVLDDLGIEDPYELTGLYDGIALTERSVMHQPTRPDSVWLYRRPILEEWIDRGDVGLAAWHGVLIVATTVAVAAKIAVLNGAFAEPVPARQQTRLEAERAMVAARRSPNQRADA